MDFVTVIALLAFGWASTISGVIVGGHLVFRASGQAGSLLSRNRGNAYNIEDGTEERDVSMEQEMPPELAKHMNRFKDSFDPGESIFGGTGSTGGGHGRHHGATRPWSPPVPPKQGAPDGGKETTASAEAEEGTGKA